MFCEDASPSTCFSAGARHALSAPSLHQRFAIRLLVEAHFHHINAYIEAEHRACKGERRTPLPGAGLGGEPLHTSLLVVKRLGYGGVGFVAARRPHPFVFVVDPGGRIERPLQATRPIERRRTPLTIDFAYWFGDLNRALCRHFLLDQRHWKQRFEILGSYRLQRP